VIDGYVMVIAASFVMVVANTGFGGSPSGVEGIISKLKWQNAKSKNDRSFGGRIHK
jgi:hypothetical protein